MGNYSAGMVLVTDLASSLERHCVEEVKGQVLDGISTIANLY